MNFIFKVKKSKYISMKTLIIFVVSFLFSIVFVQRGFATSTFSDLKITSGSAVVIDAETGAVLYAHNKDKRIYPASTTKVLSSLVALEKGNNTKDITVSENALEGQKDRGTHIGLKSGEKLTLKDALYGMILESANDAAIAVAENIGGSVEEFSNLMNQKARELGMKNSNFTNPHGWYDEKHYTTAYDMALATKAAYENEELRKILMATKHTVSKTNLNEGHDIYPTHKMFPYKSHYYEYFLGGKPGYLEESRGNLVSIAKKDNVTLIAYVATNSVGGTYDDTKKLFDFAFANYKKTDVTKDGKNNTFNKLLSKSNYKVRTVSENTEKVSALLPNDFDKSKLQFDIEANNNKYPIKKGDTVAFALVKYDGNIVAKTPVKAAKSLSKFNYFSHVLIRISKIVLPILLLLFVIIIIFLRFINRKRTMRRKSMKQIHRYRF